MNGTDGDYYVDYWLTDREKADREGAERYVVALRSRDGRCIYRFAQYDAFVLLVLSRLNRNGGTR